jgi:hypothetical protein
MRITDRFGIASAAFAAIALTAGSAQAAPQFTPTATALSHTIDSGESGTTWTTGGVGVNGQVVYTAATTSLAIGASIDSLHYYDPLNGSCPTNSGSDCTFNYGPNLGLSVVADYVGLTVTPGINGFIDITIDFQTAGGPADILWTDPADGNSVMLSASWAAGDFQGFPTTGLQVIGTYCDGNVACGGVQGLIGDPTALGFAVINASPYASLFDTGSSDGVLLDLSEFFDFDPDFDAIAGFIIANGTLPNFAGEAQGQIFRVATGDFVIPEPSTAMLLGLGLIGLATTGRRTRR